MPASTGVNCPVMMPPTMMKGMNSGSAADLNAPAISGEVARLFGTPAGPKK